MVTLRRLSGLRRLRAALIEYGAGKSSSTQLLADIQAAGNVGQAVPRFLVIEALDRAARHFGWDAHNFHPDAEGLDAVLTAASVDSANALYLLSKAARLRLYPDQIDSGREAQYLGKAIVAGPTAHQLEEYAALFDVRRGINIPYKIGFSVADTHYREAFARRYSESSESLEGLLKLGDSVANSLGHTASSLTDGWRQALYYWMRAAGSQRPLATYPSPKDFPDVPNETGCLAIARIADLFLHGKGVAQNEHLALSLLYRIRRLLPAAEHNIARAWRSGNSRPAVKRTISRAAELRSALRHLMAAEKAYPHFDTHVVLDRTTASAELACLDASKDLLAVIDKRFVRGCSDAAATGSPSGMIIEALIRLLVNTAAHEALYGGTNRLASIRAHWQRATEGGFKCPPSLNGLIADDATLESILECSERHLVEIMPPPLTSRIDTSGEPSMPVYVIADSIAAGIVNRGRITDGELWWLEFRTYLAELCGFQDRFEWQKLVRDAQLSSALPRKLGLEADDGRHAVFWKLRHAIDRASRDVGPVYNRLDEEGRLLPLTRQLLPAKSKGWNGIHRVIIQGPLVSVEGDAAAHEVPLINRDDIDVLLCLALLADDDETPKRVAGDAYSLSLEPFECAFQSNYRWRFERKVFWPRWLRETDVGRTMYFDDRLMVEANSHECALSILPGKSFENSPNPYRVQPWQRSAAVGGFQSSETNRVMLEARLPPGISMPDRLSNILGDRITIDVLQLAGFVDGGEMGFISGKEDRSIGALNWRCYAWRHVMSLSEAYTEMEEAFPVYRRARLIKSLYVSLVNGLSGISDQHLAPLKQRLRQVRLHYVDRFENETSGFDIVVA